MATNPILEEVWRIKDQLAAEADYDIDRFFDNLRKWEAGHPHSGRMVRNADELRQIVIGRDSQCVWESTSVLNDQPITKKAGD